MIPYPTLPYPTLPYPTLPYPTLPYAVGQIYPKLPNLPNPPYKYSTLPLQAGLCEDNVWQTFALADSLHMPCCPHAAQGEQTHTPPLRPRP